MTREDLVRIARTAVAGIHRPPDLENPVTYDPDEWVIEALAAAWKAGAAERAKDFVDDRPARATLQLVAAALDVPLEMEVIVAAVQAIKDRASSAAAGSAKPNRRRR